MPRQQLLSYTIVWETEDGGVQAFITCNAEQNSKKQEELSKKGIQFNTSIEARREKAG